MNITRDQVIQWLNVLAETLTQNADYLTRLDSDIGDGDHGANMKRGFQAVVTKLPTVADKDIGTIFKTVGMTLVSTVGGASGPLYGTMFMQLGTSTAGKMELTLADWTQALEAGAGGIVMRGKAQPGDKTMVDALTPALAAIKQAGAEQKSLCEALKLCAEAAAKGRDETIPLVAHKGRASYLGERSAGHQDPGATSTHLMLQAAADVFCK